MQRIPRIVFLLVLTALVSVPALAQDPHLVGSFNGYSTASGADPLPMLDDGVAPDAVAGDGIYTIEVTVTNPIQPGTHFEDYRIFPNGEIDLEVLGVDHPLGGNDLNFPLIFDYAFTSEDIVFTYDSNDLSAGGWTPASHFIDSHTRTTNFDGTARTWIAVGSFQHLVGDTDWNQASAVTVLRDDGLAGDAVAGDGILTYQFTAASTEANLEFKVINQAASPTGYVRLCTGTWDTDFTSPGAVPGVSFSVTPGSIATLEFDAGGGRMRAMVTGLTLPALLSEVAVAPAGAEFIEVYNPSGQDLDLTDTWLSDRADYYNLVVPVDSGATDFVVRFPMGSNLPAGGALVVALDGLGYETAYGLAPDFEILGTHAAPDMLAHWAGAIGASADLTEDRETLTLFVWDAATDLVMDSDYVFWGTPDAGEPAVDKTGVSVDGPDADAAPTDYNPETPAASQRGPAAPVSGQSITRVGFDEGAETCCTGNGFAGQDETSEDLDVTWEVLGAGPGCPAGEARCGGSCVDVFTDPANCGACGVTCGGGESCCSGSCTDVQTDEANCGSCGQPCGGGELCCSGACTNPDVDSLHCGGCGNACGAGELCCSGSCIDVQMDESNCGGCGNTCGAGESCCAASCIDTSGDTSNCGGCGVTCGAGENCCSGACSDPQTDELNCSACGSPCGAGQSCCTASCIDTSADVTNCGGCGVTCAGGESCCSGTCADLQTDAQHCSACGIACGAGESCCAASCIDTSGDVANCGGCGLTCAAGEGCCSGSCSDPLTDAGNCGGCGVACGAGEGCLQGLCCPDGQSNCSGACADLQTDPQNCGTCGNACQAGELCSQGACAEDCDAGLTECGGSCVDLQTNPAHCGACDNACTFVHAAALCVEGGCQIGGCDPLWGNCNGNPADGCEKDLSSDVSACGSCDNVCFYPNATSTCTTGVCSLEACAQGFEDCDTIEPNGCEADLGSVAHCGACDNACSFANATATCQAGACTMAACDTGYGDCNTNPNDGCETGLRDDVNNCGSCGLVCPAGDVCTEGACVSECPAGQTDCSGTCVDLMTNEQNCGACSSSCRPGENCQEGVCTVPTYTLSGTVRNAETNEGLSGAVLTLDALRDTVSSSDGRYIFRDVGAGAHTLSVQVTGFKSQSVDLTVADANTVQDILMEPEASSGCGCDATAGRSGTVLLVIVLLGSLLVFRRS